MAVPDYTNLLPSAPHNAIGAYYLEPVPLNNYNNNNNNNNNIVIQSFGAYHLSMSV